MPIKRRGHLEVGRVDGRFCRPIKVAQRGTRQAALQRLGQADVQRLTPTDDVAQRAARKVRLGQQAAQRRRHHLQHRDAVVLHELRQPRHVALFPRRGQHQRRARLQGHEQLHHRCVKAQ